MTLCLHVLLELLSVLIDIDIRVSSAGVCTVGVHSQAHRHSTELAVPYVVSEPVSRALWGVAQVSLLETLETKRELLGMMATGATLLSVSLSTTNAIYLAGRQSKAPEGH
jgi:hypothetical protein